MNMMRRQKKILMQEGMEYFAKLQREGMSLEDALVKAREIITESHQNAQFTKSFGN
jgi:hypothetical protein